MSDYVVWTNPIPPVESHVALFEERRMSKKVIQTIEEYQDGRGYKVIDSKELIQCKDCKHRPIRLEEDEDEKGFNLKFPDEQCPCYCDDGYYNWMPSDDWYCGNGERK